MSDAYIHVYDATGIAGPEVTTCQHTQPVLKCGATATARTQEVGCMQMYATLPSIATQCNGPCRRVHCGVRNLGQQSRLSDSLQQHTCTDSSSNGRKALHTTSQHATDTPRPFISILPASMAHTLHSYTTMSTRSPLADPASATTSSALALLYLRGEPLP